MMVGRDLVAGILDTLVVAEDEGVRLGGKLDSPEEWERCLEERQD